MAALPALRALTSVNTVILRIGRTFAWIAIGLMTLIILLQVVARYVFNAALPWPDEAARFLMLWMTGMVAPSAYRWGGFVAIDMVSEALSKKLADLLALCLLTLSFFVLAFGLSFGIDHVNSGWLFSSSSLKIPLQWFGGERPYAIKLAWMYMSLAVGLGLLLLVNIELILRSLVRLIDPDADLPVDPDNDHFRTD